MTESRTSSFAAVLSVDVEENAESVRTVSAPVAPPPRTRLTVSVSNDAAPWAAPSLPPRSRHLSTCPVSAQVVSCRW